MKTPLSVVIPTFNEAENIAACIQSIDGLAEEILILDNFSEDGTAELARTLDAKVHQREFDNYSANKNAAIEIAKSDWILILDADERLTPALRNEIEKVLSTPKEDAFAIKRDAYFCGTKVRCWSGKSVVRLFRKQKGAYDPSRLVHEELVVNGTTGALQNSMEHYTFRSFEQYLPKIQSFTSLAAREAFLKGQRTGWFSLLFYPPLRFLKTYIVRGGILDGIPGLLIASLSAYSVFLKNAKLWELQRSHG
jgi:cellulose synthase/poly-beta-1,6-N-acetylglucosamine synthase-like glycosyltransferase